MKLALLKLINGTLLLHNELKYIHETCGDDDIARCAEGCLKTIATMSDSLCEVHEKGGLNDPKMA